MVPDHPAPCCVQVQQLHFNRSNQHQHSHLHSRFQRHHEHDLWAQHVGHLDSAGHPDRCSDKDDNSGERRIPRVSPLMLLLPPQGLPLC